MGTAEWFLINTYWLCSQTCTSFECPLFGIRACMKVSMASAGISFMVSSIRNYDRPSNAIWMVVQLQVYTTLFTCRSAIWKVSFSQSTCRQLPMPYCVGYCVCCRCLWLCCIWLPSMGPDSYWDPRQLERNVVDHRYVVMLMLCTTILHTAHLCCQSADTFR